MRSTEKEEEKSSLVDWWRLIKHTLKFPRDLVFDEDILPLVNALFPSDFILYYCRSEISETYSIRRGSIPSERAKYSFLNAWRSI